MKETKKRKKERKKERNGRMIYSPPCTVGTREIRQNPRNGPANTGSIEYRRETLETYRRNTSCTTTALRTVVPYPEGTQCKRPDRWTRQWIPDHTERTPAVRYCFD